MRLFFYSSLIVVLLLISQNLSAQIRTSTLDSNRDPRGVVDLTLCSQNLDNYGSFQEARRRKSTDYTKELYFKKERSVIKRFLKIQCDVIALQEVLGSTREVAQKVVDHLAFKLYKATNRSFEGVVAKSQDKNLYNGFLLAKDRVTLLDKVSYSNVELPKIAEDQKQRFFSRGPLEVQIGVKGQDGAGDRVVTAISFHFKSKSFKGGYDPTGLEFEPYRMEMAEALRRIVELRHRNSFAMGKSLLVLMGDRNSHFDSASAKILEGIVHLKHFQDEGACRLSQRGVPLCQPNVTLPQKLFSVLTTDRETGMLSGTLKYKSVYSWIDDIIMPAESLPFAWERDGQSGNYDSGVFYQFPEASDHALAYVRLNW